MKKRTMMAVLGCIFLMFVAVNATAETITFSAADVISVMAANSAPLHNSTNQWGLWAVRVMPIVTGGTYTITGGSTTQPGWGVSAPNGAFGASPYSAANSAWFWDASGAEVAGNPANPLYMIMDQPAGTFTSYFGNIVTAVDPTSTFTFTFTLGEGATWSGGYQFVVDGSKYALGTLDSPGGWVSNFFGGYGGWNGFAWIDIPNGGLSGNSGAGYIIPVYSSTGFFLPPADVPLKVKVKKNRVIPFKAVLLDAAGNIVTSLPSPPVIQVWYSSQSSDSGNAADVTILYAGQGTEGNQFVYSDGKWQFNLQVKGYAPGTYTVQMVPGGSYIISPLPTATFVVE